MDRPCGGVQDVDWADDVAGWEPHREMHDCFTDFSTPGDESASVSWDNGLFLCTSDPCWFGMHLRAQLENGDVMRSGGVTSRFWGEHVLIRALLIG